MQQIPSVVAFYTLACSRIASFYTPAHLGETARSVVLVQQNLTYPLSKFLNKSEILESLNSLLKFESSDWWFRPFNSFPLAFFWPAADVAFAGDGFLLALGLWSSLASGFFSSNSLGFRSSNNLCSQLSRVFNLITDSKFDFIVVSNARMAGSFAN